MEREAGCNQKLKLLYLAQIFQNETDEQHPLSVYDLIESLARMDISANRKTIKDDIELLTDFGMDIITVSLGKAKGYYLGAREFEMTELKLLADAVSSSRFITEKKSRTLLKKLEKLAGSFSGREIDRSVFISNRIKSENELIYISVDTIARAINEKKKISFRQFDYDLQKNRKYREGERICSPYALTWSDGNYYLVAYYEKYGSLSNFRVDRMSEIKVLDEDTRQLSKEFDLAGYMNTTFSMFSGEEEQVRLRFDNTLVNAVIDKFGMDVMLMPDKDDKFTVNAKVKVGQPFFAWIFQFGDKAEIISPSWIRNRFTDMISETLSAYGEEKKMI